MSDIAQVHEAVEKVAASFESLKAKNEEMLAEERKGNEARARELAEQLEKISASMTDNTKTRDLLLKKLEMQSTRLEMLEALNDRPKTSIKDRIRGEHKDLMIQLIRTNFEDQAAREKLRELREKAMELKDVSIGSNAGGGFAVPEEIAEQVDKILLKTSEILQYVKNVRVGTTDYKELVSVNDAGYAWAAETTSRSSNTATPELRNRALTFGELYAYPRATNWSLKDIFFDVEAWLIDNLSEAFSVGLSAAIWNGDGSNKPTGMINQAPASSADGNEASPQRNASAYQYVPIPLAGSSPFTTSGLTTDTIINLMYALNPRYRPNARFSANTTTQGHLRKLKDTTGQYLWQPSLQAGQPDRLLGYPIFTWEQMGNPTSINAYPVAFGDFAKAYTLATISEIEIIRENVTVPGYTNWYVSRRYGGVVTNNAALKFAKVALS